MGWDNPLAVYITYPDLEYGFGSQVNVTVHVFKEGVRYAPTNVTLTVGITERPVDLTAASVGTYTGNFTIEQTDVSAYGNLALVANVEDGPEPDVAGEWAGIYLGLDRFQVDVSDPDDAPWTYGPGDTIELMVNFTFDGAPADPDAGSIVSEVKGPSGTNDPLPLSRISTGVYEASIAIPSDLVESATYTVMVEADHTFEGFPYTAEQWTEFYVDFLVLWAHYTDVSLQQTKLDIYVMNLSQSMMGGASVVADYTYTILPWDQKTKQATATTDEAGKANLTLDHPDVSPEDAHVNIEGFVEKDGLKQAFDMYLQLTPDDGGVDPYESLSVVLMDEEPLHPATAMDLDFQAYSLGVPLASQSVIVYVSTPTDMLFSGNVSTDADGKFAIPVTTPAVATDDWGFINCEFQAQLLEEWVSDSDTYDVTEFTGSVIGELEYLMDPETTVSVGPFRAGGTADVVLDNLEADGTDEQAVVFWMVGDPGEMWDAQYVEWEPLCESGGFYGSPTIPAVWSDGAFRASFEFPEFFGTDVEVFVVGLILFGDPAGGDIRGAFVKDLVPLPANPAPAVAITTPVAGEQYSGILAVTGTASDDTLVEGVEVRIDGGAWTAVSGTTGWTMSLDTATLSSGTHMLEVRAYDGDKHSPVVKVVFEVDQPPTVAITSPAPNARATTTLPVAGTAADDGSVDRVEYRVDAGPWDPATGTASWTAEVNVAGLATGAHTLEVRSSDGERTSVVAQLPFVVDTRPSVTISSPVNATTQKKAFEFTGTAADDVAVTKVEVRLDGGPWANATGTTAWSWQVSTKGLAAGDHTLQVRSWDGYAYSELATITFAFKKPDDSPAAGAALALLTLLGAAGVASMAARGRRL